MIVFLIYYSEVQFKQDKSFRHWLTRSHLPLNACMHMCTELMEELEVARYDAAPANGLVDLRVLHCTYCTYIFRCLVPELLYNSSCQGHISMGPLNRYL
jgi:hypothetical protein